MTRVTEKVEGKVTKEAVGRAKATKERGKAKARVTKASLFWDEAKTPNAPPQ